MSGVSRMTMDSKVQIQPIASWKLTIETLEHGVKRVQS